ncbi:hypothetical protein [Bacillus alkalisoli]|nr:hypothetical protein [Bacillus alkalisoli]
MISWLVVSWLGKPKNQKPKIKNQNQKQKQKQLEGSWLAQLKT